MESQNQLREASGADSNAIAEVELFDNGSSLGWVPVADGLWEKNMSGLGVGKHTFIAKSVDGRAVSEPWVIWAGPLRGAENFDLLPSTIISVGQTIDSPTMTIRFVDGDGQVGIQPWNYYTAHGYPEIPGRREGQMLHMNLAYVGVGSRQIINLELKGACSRVSFWDSYSSPSVVYVSFYDINGSLLGGNYLPGSETSAVQTVFSGKDINKISFETRSQDWFALDFFTFE